MNNKKHILVVDDDERIRKLLQRFLRENNYIVSATSNAKDATKLTQIIRFDLLIVDVMMPDTDGLKLTRNLLKEISTPIILLTARNEISDRIVGLETGADDYISKPFEPRELLLRIEKILKRIQHQLIGAQIPKIIKIGNLRYDNYRNELWRDDNILTLTLAERLLMKELVKSVNIPVQRTFLAKILFQETANRASLELKEDQSLINLQRERGVDVNINRLRKKIEEEPKSPRYIRTVRGIGYVLVPD
jgi:two-component system phosphate regulon response regulator OmpR